MERPKAVGKHRAWGELWSKGEVDLYMDTLETQVTAFRGALEATLPLLKEELDVLRRSYLPNPSEDESVLLAAHTEAVKKIESLLSPTPK